jgi:hypothetical protein
MTENERGLRGEASDVTPNRTSQFIRSTRLQAYLRVTFDVLADARDELDDDSYRAYLWTLEERIGLEAARLVAGEAIRAKRESAA